MIRAVLDTNVFVQALIGSTDSASVRTLRALDSGQFQLVFSPATIDELLEVLLLPQIRQRHGLTDDEILRFVMSFLAESIVVPKPSEPTALLTRDLTDTKFLGLTSAAQVDFLVTNDHRHLLTLGEYENTRIVTPAMFLRELG